MMSLVKFRDWVLTKESSPATRSKQQAALGLGPDYISVFGRSTPAPWQVERLTKKAKKKGDKTKYKVPGEDPPKPVWNIPEKNQNPDYSFDQWLQAAMRKSKELESDKESAEKEDQKLDKEIADKLKEKEKEDKTSTPEPEPPQGDNDDDDDEVIGRDTKWSGHKKERQDREKAGVGLGKSDEKS